MSGRGRAGAGGYSVWAAAGSFSGGVDEGGIGDDTTNTSPALREPGDGETRTGGLWWQQCRPELPLAHRSGQEELFESRPLEFRCRPTPGTTSPTAPLFSARRHPVRAVPAAGAGLSCAVLPAPHGDIAHPDSGICRLSGGRGLMGWLKEGIWLREVTRPSGGRRVFISTAICGNNSDVCLSSVPSQSPWAVITHDADAGSARQVRLQGARKDPRAGRRHPQWL